MGVFNMKTRGSRVVKSLIAAGLLTAAGCGRVADNQGEATAGRDGCEVLAEAATAYIQKCLPYQAIDLARAQRFAAECKMVVGAPGVSGFGATLAACETAFESAAATCAAIEALPCLPPRGALSNGAPCGADPQCASGLCSAGGIDAPSVAQNATTTPALGMTRGACGTCAPCTGACASGLVCQEGNCVPPPPGDVGESCADHSCKDGLQCYAPNFTCAVLPAEGEACVSERDLEGLEIGCAAPFVCQRAMGVMGTCVRGTAEGERCSPPALVCARGLQRDLLANSDPNQPAAGTCSKATHIPAAGQPCEGAQVCASGICASGKCPFPIPDGQACEAEDQRAARAPCNYFSRCIAGTCVLFDPSSCK